jgi:hypothetical protein
MRRRSLLVIIGCSVAVLITALALAHRAPAGKITAAVATAVAAAALFLLRNG